jgi:hypothetical protein
MRVAVIARSLPRRNFIYRFDMGVRRFCGVGINGLQLYFLPTFHFHV